VNLPGVTGTLDGLNDDGMVAPDSWQWPVGSRIPVHLPDGRVVTLRVAATYHAVRGGDVAYLPERLAGTAAYAGNGLVKDVYLSLAPGAGQAAALTAVRRAAADGGARLVTREQLASSASGYSAHVTQVRQESTAVVILLFCFIAILNTLLMATAQRRRDVAVLRAVGATPRQVLWFFVAESAVVMAIALMLAGAATAVNLSALRIALRQLFGSAPMSVPWLVIAGITTVSGLLALTGTVLPVVMTLRARTISLVSTGG
jgi:putative ABC transport system permease protein